METRNSMKIFKRSKDKGSIDVGSLVKKYTERMEGHTVLNQGSWDHFMLNFWLAAFWEFFR